MHDYWECGCNDCIRRRDDAVDAWIDAQPEREQRHREELDAAGYYDGDPNWHTNLQRLRQVHRVVG